MQPVMQAAQPVVQAAQPAAQPQYQLMQVMVQDPVTGQFVPQIMKVIQDPATGNYIPAPDAVDPAAAEKARKAAEKAAADLAKAEEKAARDAAKAIKEQEAAERRARADQLREEAAERARRNDSIAGRVKNTAISTATREVVRDLTKGIGKAINDLIGGGKK